ncbi:MAG: hypothetical protein KC680_03700 [Candidatus Peregrinibacteria bacterium]|nr:hypothetical protein [Candidatus Peregrinibacteria bacterium]
MADRTAHVCGKIILSGEYAVLFGYTGIAIPSSQELIARFTENTSTDEITLEWDAHPLWITYAQKIIKHCREARSVAGGTLAIENHLPLGKGMGSSTALNIAITGVLLDHHYKEPALHIEDRLNPGHSGLDFAVIWNKQPMKFTKGSEPEPIHLPENLLKDACLIDTGTPHEQTPELIAWITERKEELQDALKTIGSCADRLLSGEDLATVIRDHHQAQCSLGIVTEEAKELIKKIEQEGGAAKVIGAGARTGGCGMILSTLTPQNSNTLTLSIS